MSRIKNINKAAVAIATGLAFTVVGFVHADPISFDSYAGNGEATWQVGDRPQGGIMDNWAGGNPFSFGHSGGDQDGGEEGISQAKGYYDLGGGWGSNYYNQSSAVKGEMLFYEGGDAPGFAYASTGSLFTFTAASDMSISISMLMFATSEDTGRSNVVTGDIALNGVGIASWSYASDGSSYQNTWDFQAGDEIAIELTAGAGAAFGNDRRENIVGKADYIFGLEAYSTMVPLPSAALAGLLGLGGVIGCPRRRRLA